MPEVACPAGWRPPTQEVVDVVHTWNPRVWPFWNATIGSVRLTQPVTIISWWRADAVNAACGGVPNSWHRWGLALDLGGPGAREAAEQLEALGWREIIAKPSGAYHVAIFD